MRRDICRLCDFSPLLWRDLKLPLTAGKGDFAAVLLILSYKTKHIGCYHGKLQDVQADNMTI